MSYREEEIKKYLNILSNYKKTNNQFVLKFKCKGCTNTESFSSYLGYNMCNECGVLNGYILGNIELKDFDRLHGSILAAGHRTLYKNSNRI